MEHSRPQVVLFNLTFDLSIILTTTIAAILVFFIAYLATRNLTEGIPKKWQNLTEWIMDFVRDIMNNGAKQ